MSQNNKESINTFDNIQLPQENFTNNNIKLYNNILTGNREKMTFAQLKTNDIATSGKSSISLSSLLLKGKEFLSAKRECFH